MEGCLLARLSLVAALSIAIPARHASAHGGQYNGPPPSGGSPPAAPAPPPPNRGPGDITPPHPGGPGIGGPGVRGPSAPPPTAPATGGPSAPAGPGPSRPSTPGPGGPAGPGPSAGPAAPARAGTTTPRGVELEVDRSTWELWWELHKEPYLRAAGRARRNAAQTGSDEFYLGSTRNPPSLDLVGPTAHDVESVVLPALRRTLDATSHRDVVTAAMIAMAKTGCDHSTFRIFDQFTPRLADLDQEVRETAALAIGISGQRSMAQIALLADLARDDEAGRRLCRRAEVDDRTRSFAAYALGLLGEGPADAANRHRAAATLLALVEDRRLSSRNVKVAAIAALGLLGRPAGEGAAAAIGDVAAQGLGEYFLADLGRAEELVQAHCPPAIARILARDSEAAAHWRHQFTAVLEGRGGKRSAPIAQSCALALAAMCDPVDDENARDAGIVAVLLRTWQEHADVQTRNFAIMALGQIGGSATREQLLRELSHSRRSLELPWVALALGVHVNRRGAGVDADAGGALLVALRTNKNPSTRGALAIALGLCGHQVAAVELAGLLDECSDEALCGHLCIGLGLLGAPGTQGELRAVLERSLRRPELLRQAATALAAVGDRQAADLLLPRLQSDSNLARLAAIAQALGAIRDRRSLEPLARVLEDPEPTSLARAFAAAALGAIADPRELPWNTTLRGYVNYRAATETLWDGAAGILDIL